MRRLRNQSFFVMGTLVVTLLSAGCFVFDELDEGQQRMDKHSSRSASRTATAEDSGGGMDFAALRARGAEQFGSIKESVEEALRPKPHPDDVIVSCRIDGGTQFMRKFSCQSLGGRVLSR